MTGMKTPSLHRPRYAARLLVVPAGPAQISEGVSWVWSMVAMQEGIGEDLEPLYVGCLSVDIPPDEQEVSHAYAVKDVFRNFERPSLKQN